MRPPARRDATPLLLLAAATLLLHLALSGRYGFWIDELYFIACGEHLDWGYVDHPPLIAFAAQGSRVLLGDSLFAIRFFPALAHAGLVLLTGWLARALGAGRFGQVLAALTVLGAPVYLAFGNLLTMNAFEPLLWTALASVIVFAVRREQPRWLIAGGAIVGFGLLNKHSMGFFAAALGAGLVLTPERRVLRPAWVGAAALVCIGRGPTASALAG